MTTNVAYRDRDLVVFTNPSRAEYLALHGRLKTAHMRAFLYNGMLAIWDAYLCPHQVIAAILGVPPKQWLPFDIVDHRAVIADPGHPDIEARLAAVQSSRAVKRILGDPVPATVERV